MVLKSTFRGLMAPVFTPFTAGGQLNLAEVPKYAKYLLNKKVNAVLVNGTVGEGVLMSVEERKKLTESWVAATKTTGQQVMVHVGGTNLNSVVQLAKHAESLSVSAILCLPDLFFRPTTINELTDYLKIVSASAPKTPLFYYNYPRLTGVNLDMIQFLEKAYSEIPTLAGLKYTHNNLDEGIRCVQLRDRTFTIFLGYDQLISAAFFIGFDSTIGISVNFAADEIYELLDIVKNGDKEKAEIIQKRLTDLAYFVNSETQRINGFKATVSLTTGLDLGNPRPPLKALTAEQLTKLKAKLKQDNWI